MNFLRTNGVMVVCWFSIKHDEVQWKEQEDRERFERLRREEEGFSLENWISSYIRELYPLLYKVIKIECNELL